MLGLYVTVPIACFRKGLAREYLETEPVPPPATCYGFLLSLVGETKRSRHVGCRVAPVLVNKPSTSVVLRTVWRVKEHNYWTDPNNIAHVLGASALVNLREWLRAVVVELLVSQQSSGSLGSYLAGEAWRSDLERVLAKVKWEDLVQAWIKTKPDAPTLDGKNSKDFFKSQKDLKNQVDGWLKREDQFVVGLGCGENARPDYQQLLTGVELLIWMDSSHESDDGLETRVRFALTNPETVSRFGGLCLGESTHLVDEVTLVEKMRPRLFERTGRSFLIAPKGRLTLPVWVDHVGSAGTRYVTGDLVARPLLQQPSVGEMPQINPGGSPP